MVKVIKYNVHNVKDTQQLAALFNRNGRYQVSSSYPMLPEDWILTYYAKEIQSLYILKERDKVIGCIGVFKYTIRGDAPRGVIYSGCLLIDSKYRNGAAIYKLYKYMSTQVYLMHVGYLIAEIRSNNRPSLQLSKLNGYTKTPYSWDNLYHDNSYVSCILVAAMSFDTNIPLCKINHNALALLRKQDIKNNNLNVSFLFDKKLHRMQMNIACRYPFYLWVQNRFSVSLTQDGTSYEFKFNTDKLHFTHLTISNADQSKQIKLTHNYGQVNLKRTSDSVYKFKFSQNNWYLNVTLQRKVPLHNYYRNFDTRPKRIMDLHMKYKMFHLFFDLDSGDLYFFYNGYIWLTDVFAKAYYLDDVHFDVTNDNHDVKILMYNQDYKIIKLISLVNGSIHDKYKVLRCHKNVLSKAGLSLNHQDYKIFDDGRGQYLREVPYMDVNESENAVCKRLFNGKCKKYLIEHLDLILKVMAKHSSNQLGLRPLILMKITRGAQYRYQYSLTPLKHSLLKGIQHFSSKENYHRKNAYNVSNVYLGQVPNEEAVSLQTSRQRHRIHLENSNLKDNDLKITVGKVSNNGYFSRLEFQMGLFLDPVVHLTDGEVRKLTNFGNKLETLGQIVISDGASKIGISAPHSWINLYLDNNWLHVQVVCEEKTVVHLY